MTTTDTLRDKLEQTVRGAARGTLGLADGDFWDTRQSESAADALLPIIESHTRQAVDEALERAALLLLEEYEGDREYHPVARYCASAIRSLKSGEAP